MLKEDRGFVPGRPVGSNPYSILPQDVSSLFSVSLLEDQMSVPISNLFYACYEPVMQIDNAHRGNRCATGPAGQSNPGMNAGPSFRFTRSGTAAPQTPGWKLFVERMNEMSAYCGKVHQSRPWLASKRLWLAIPSRSSTPQSNTVQSLVLGKVGPAGL